MRPWRTILHLYGTKCHLPNTFRTWISDEIWSTHTAAMVHDAHRTETVEFGQFCDSMQIMELVNNEMQCFFILHLVFLSIYRRNRLKWIISIWFELFHDKTYSHISIGRTYWLWPILFVNAFRNGPLILYPNLSMYNRTSFKSLMNNK